MSGGGFPYLTTMVLLPAGAAVVVAVLPSTQRRLVQLTGMIASLAVLGIAAASTAEFTTGFGGYQFVSSHQWISAFGISWSLGMDGISLFLVLMTALLFPIALAASGDRGGDKSFVAWILVLEAGCIGSFLVLDLLLFFLFFELTLVPVYMLIAGWGHERRGYAAGKFFLYTLGASAFLFVGILALVGIHASQTGVTTFDVRALADTHLSGTAGILLFLAFTAAFAVKTPIFPFHTWSPDAYREAPAAGSMLLAGVMAKLGTYGIIRFDLALFPRAVVTLAPLLLTLGAIGIIYGAVVAAVERDLKRLVAYSSLAHLGFIVIGAFALTREALTGAVLQMVNHGLYTAALFILIAVLYRRLGTFSVRDMRGLQRRVPVLAAVFTLVMLASIGVPGLNGFVGEFLILAGTFLTHRWWAVVATGGVVLAAVYLLWAYQQAFQGKPTIEPGAIRDLTWREGLTLAPLVILIVLLGILPGPLLDRIGPSVTRIVAHVEAVAHEPAPRNRPDRLGAEASYGGPAMSLFSFVGSLPGLLGAATFPTPHVNYVAILPELILIGGALLLLVSGQLVFVKVPTAFYSIGSGAVATGALVASLVLWHDTQARGPFTAIGDSVAVDGFSIVFLVLVSCVLILASAIGWGFLTREGIEGPEYHVLALLAGSGAMLMAAANDLILIFVALEIMSIPLYVLAGMDLRRRESGEAAMKYFVLGAFSSAIFVYGIALVYGATGSTNLAQIADYLSANVVTSNGILLAGLGLLLVGFGFKVSAVPFHMWTPDVYQGAPTPVTGFMTAIAKAGGFAALLRVFFSSFGTLRTDWQPLLWAIAILTLLLGAILGLVQRDVKRMLAYSSINHAGFILVGLAAATSKGISGSVYYVFVYALIVVGSFAVVTVVGRRGDREHDLDSYRGLGRRQPALALAFTVLLLAQTGVPFTTGFLAKLYVVSAAVRAHSYALAVIAMLSATIAAAFYLRLVFLMYGIRLPAGSGNDAGSLSLSLGGEAPGEVAPASSEPPTASPGPISVPVPTAVAIFVTVAVTVVFGIWPAPLVDFVRSAGLLF